MWLVAVAMRDFHEPFQTVLHPRAYFRLLLFLGARTTSRRPPNESSTRVNVTKSADLGFPACGKPISIVSVPTDAKVTSVTFAHCFFGGGMPDRGTQLPGSRLAGIEK